MYRTDDPIKDFERYSIEQEEEMAKLPVCTYCGEKITDDIYFEINGECVCEDCLIWHHRRTTEDYAE